MKVFKRQSRKKSRSKIKLIINSNESSVGWGDAGCDQCDGQKTSAGQVTGGLESTITTLTFATRHTNPNHCHISIVNSSFRPSRMSLHFHYEHAKELLFVWNERSNAATPRPNFVSQVSESELAVTWRFLELGAEIWNLWMRISDPLCRVRLRNLFRPMEWHITKSLDFEIAQLLNDPSDSGAFFLDVLVFRIRSVLTDIASIKPEISLLESAYPLLDEDLSFLQHFLETEVWLRMLLTVGTINKLTSGGVCFWY